MRDFAELMRAPGLARVVGTQLAARFPAGMYSLGLLMHIQGAKGNYTEAGLVLAAFSVGMAVAGPIISRQLSRLGTLPVLIVTLIISSGAITALALFPTLPLAALLGLAVLGGAAMPPVIPAVRTLYPKLSPSNLLNALFSLDAALQEIIWVIGPLLITVLVGAFGSTTALLVVVGIQVAGGLLFTLDPLVRKLRIPASTRKFGRVLANRSVLLVLVVSMLFLGSFAAIEAGVVATFEHGSIQTGLVLAASSVASLIGGLWAGNRPLKRWSFPLRLLIIVIGFGLATLTSGFWGLVAALFLAGLGIAPALAAVSSMVAKSVSFSDTAEAYGWIGTGQLLGISLGSALAGVAIDASGADGGIVVALVIALLSFAVAAIFRSAQPDEWIAFIEG